jgi:hypothetical protein
MSSIFSPSLTALATLDNLLPILAIAIAESKRTEIPIQRIKLKVLSPFSADFACASVSQGSGPSAATEVKFTTNEFYEDYKEIHEKLQKGELDKVTVETIGGTNCQRCHY